MISLTWQSVFGTTPAHAQGSSNAAAALPTSIDLAERNAADWGAGEAEAYPSLFSTTISDDLTIHPYGDASVKFETDSAYDWWAYYPQTRDANWDLSGESALSFWIHTQNSNSSFQSPLTVRLGDSMTNGYFEYTNTTNIINQSSQTDGLLTTLPFAGNTEWQLQTVGDVALSHIDYIEIHTDTWDSGFTVWMDGLYLHGAGSIVADSLPVIADAATENGITIQALAVNGDPIPDAPIQLGIASGETISINGTVANQGDWVTVGNTDSSGVIHATVRASSAGERLFVARIINGAYLGSANINFVGNESPTETATVTPTDELTATHTPENTETPCPSGWCINGTAQTSAVADQYILTQDALWQNGSVWNATPINLNDDFDKRFSVYLGSNDGGADGLVFVLQNAGTGTQALGGAGVGLGYVGISPSVGVELDTWQNGELGDPNYDHIAVDENGQDNHQGAAPVQASESSANIEDGAEHALRITWSQTSQTLTVFFDGAERLVYTKDIINDIFGGNPQVYFGFTGTTGGASNLQYVIMDTMPVVTATSTATQTPEVTSTPTTAASTGTPFACTAWDLAHDFRNAPGQENPNRDACNNMGVWEFMGSAGLERNPDGYYTLADFTPTRNNMVDLPFWRGTYSDGYTPFPMIGLNDSSETRNVGDATMPANTVDIHPAPDQLGVIAWHSPITGYVSIGGGVGDNNANGGDGILWYLDKNTASLASGGFENGGAQNFEDGTGGTGLNSVAVSIGDVIYLAIHPKGEYTYDDTRVDISIHAVSAPTITSTPTITPYGGPAWGQYNACTNSLSWAPVAGATAYDVYTWNGNPGEPVTSTTTSIALLDAAPSVQPGDQRYWRVDARLANNEIAQGHEWPFISYTPYPSNICAVQVAPYTVGREANLHALFDGNLAEYALINPSAAPVSVTIVFRGPVTLTGFSSVIGGYGESDTENDWSIEADDTGSGSFEMLLNHQPSNSGTVTLTLPQPHRAKVFRVTSKRNNGDGFVHMLELTPLFGTPSASSIVASASKVPADGSSAATLTITVLDQDGIPVANAPVSITANGHGTLSQPDVTDANGTTQASITNDTAETVTLTAKTGTTTIGSVNVQFTPLPTDPDHSMVSVSAAPTLVANNQEKATLTVTLLNRKDRPQANHVVRLYIPGSVNNVFPGTAHTNAAGVATFRLSSTQAGEKIIRVIDDTNQVTLSNMPQLTFVPGPVNAIQSRIGTSFSAVAADGTSAANFVVTAYDSFANPIPGANVVIHTNGAALVDPSTALTNSVGQASFAVTDTTPETVTVSVTINGVLINATSSVRFRAADVSVQMSALSISNNGNSTSTAASGFPITYTITLTNLGLLDANNVTVTNTLPATLTFQSATPSDALTQNGNELSWVISRIAPGASVQLEVTAQISANFTGLLIDSVQASISGVDDNLDNNTAQVTTSVEAPRPVLSLIPVSSFAAVTQGDESHLTVTIRNTGLAATDGISITPPPSLEWLSIEMGGTNLSLAPGAETTFQVSIAPSTATTPGYYRDFVTVSSPGDGQKRLALTIQVGAPKHVLRVTVKDDQGATLPGARVFLQNSSSYVVVTEGAQTQAYQLNASAQADANGVAIFNDLEAGNYEYLASAAKHIDLNGELVMPATQDSTATIILTALPSLSVSPSAPVLSVPPGGNAVQSFTIQNDGSAPLHDIVITPGTDLPAWVYLGTTGAIPVINPGQSVSFSLFASPPASETRSIVGGHLTVSAAGGLSATITLTTRLEAVGTRPLTVQVKNVLGQPVTSGGSVLLTRQEASVQDLGGVQTTYHEQYSQPLAANGSAQFASLPPGDYNYTIQAPKYKRNADMLNVAPNTSDGAPQVFGVTMQTDSFNYEWTVEPIQVGYDIHLTLTYDTVTAEPGLFIPPRYWSFRTCDSAQLQDTITLYNPTDLPLDLTDFSINVPGTSVSFGSIPPTVAPHSSVNIPVTVFRTGEPGQGLVEAPFNYLGAKDPYVTYTFNPSSRTDLMQLGQTYQANYNIAPGVFTPGVVYAVQVGQTTTLDWLSLATDASPSTWDADTSIPLTLTAQTPTSLADGTYQDEIPVMVTGSNGAERSGNLLVEVVKNAQGISIHTSYELGPIPTEIKSGASNGFIVASLQECSTGGGGGGGGGSSASGGGWSWGWVYFPGGWGLQGSQTSSNPAPVPPPFPQLIPPPIVYGDGHQEVRLGIDQHVMLEGEGFKAQLSLNAKVNLGDVNVALKVTDLNDEDRTEDFTISPNSPSAFGDIAAGDQQAKDWLILPSGLNVTEQAGQTFNVSAIISWVDESGERLSIQTAPAEITVLPAPNLEITYNLPRNDQQCTTFPLQVVFHNVGAGTARNVHFSSAQPKLIGNTQLPISFILASAAVDGVAKDPTLDMDLGDIAPGGEKTVTFVIRSNRPGRFVEFTSDYRQTDYVGQSLKPLISKITTQFVLSTECGVISCSTQATSSGVVAGMYTGSLATPNDVLPFTTITNVNMPTEFSARVFLPADYTLKSHPLLVFLHGKEPGVTTSEKGYDYLACPLAEKGFIVISIDADQISGFPDPRIVGQAWDSYYHNDRDYFLARGRLVLRHMALWSRWNLGLADPATTTPNSLTIQNFDPADLMGHVEMNHIGLMGHSRGGEGVRAAFNYLRGPIGSSSYPWPSELASDTPTIDAIFEIAPTDAFNGSGLDALNADGVIWNVLLPLCDGDVDDLSGIRPFDRMLHETIAPLPTNVPAPSPDQKSVMLVWGANHNSFNTEWAPQPEPKGVCSGDYNGTYASNFAVVDSDPNSAKRLLPAGDLQKIALYAITQFFESNVGDDPDRSGNRLFNPLAPLPPAITDITRVERNFTVSPNPAYTTLLVDFKDVDPAAGDKVGVDYEKISSANGPVSPKYDLAQFAGLITWPGAAPQAIPSFQVNWLSSGSGLYAAGLQTLDLRLARAVSEKNASDASTDFSLCLVLNDDTCSAPVRLSRYLSLVGPAGGVTSDGVTASPRPVLQTVRIPLTDFSVTNLTLVRGLRLVFDKTKTGSIYLADIGVSKALGYGINQQDACSLSDPSPADTSIQVNQTLTLHWTETNCDGYKRRLYLSNKLVDVALPIVPTAGQSVIEPLGTSFPLTNLTLEVGKTYYWRVVTYQDLGNGLTGNVSQSDIWSFDYRDKLPLIFIPGIGGSYLTDTADNKQLWLGTPFDNARDRLNLYPETNPANTIVAPDIIRSLLFGNVKVYSPLIDGLVSKNYFEYNLGTTASEMASRRTTAGCDTSQISSPNKPLLFVFPYDWRRSNKDSAAALKEYMGCIQKFYPGTQVDIVTHSMGGLVARRYILDNQNDHLVRKLISIATPWLGAAKAIDALENGNFMTGISQTLFAPPARLKTMVGSFTGASELLPSQPVFNFGAFPLEEDGWDLLADHPSTIAKVYTNYAEFVSLLNARHNHPGFTPSPGDAGSEFHTNSQDNWNTDSSGVEYYHLYSLQKKNGTMAANIATSALDCRKIGPITLWCPGEKLAWEYKWTSGDQSVSALSASRLVDPIKAIQTCTDWVIQNVICRQKRSDDPLNWGLNAPNAQLFAFVSPDEQSDKIYEHGAIQNLPSAQDLLAKILTNSLDASSAPAPADAPAGADSAYYLTVDGTTQFAILDDLGNSTSLGMVPNVSVLDSGEQVDTAVLPANANYTVKFQTTSDPLSIKILEEDHNNQITHLVRYEDVTLPANINAEFVINASGTIDKVQYDGDGNGSYETALLPSMDVTGELARDQKSPTLTENTSYASYSVFPTVSLMAQDAGSAGLQQIYYSLDGHTFQPYTTPFTLDTTQHSLVYAFADDNVDNRSNLYTFQIPAVPSSTSNDEIVFNRRYTINDSDLVIMNADGTNARKLTSDGASDGQPAWSPDGRQILFISNRDSLPSTPFDSGHFSLYVMNADGSNIRRLTSGADVYQPAWSPDGQKIAYNDGDGITWVSLDGTSSGDLTNAQLAQPAWLSNSQIIYHDLSSGSGDGGLYLENIYTPGVGNRQYLTEGRDPAVSPDGTKLAFFGMDGPVGGQSIVVCEIANCEATRRAVVSLPGSYVEHPSWSPDGNYITFYSDFTPDEPTSLGIHVILKVKVDDGTLWQLTPHFMEGSDDPKLWLLGLGDANPAWKPRGCPAAPPSASGTVQLQGIQDASIPSNCAIDSSEAKWKLGNFEIHVFNVGQADSQLIISPTGKTMLIDVGEELSTGATNTNAESVAQKIRAIMPTGTNRIDYLVVSHLHKDHIGNAGPDQVANSEVNGIRKLLDSYGFVVGQLIDRDAGTWQDRNNDQKCTNDEITWTKAGITTANQNPIDSMYNWLCYVLPRASLLNRTTPGVNSPIDLGGGVSATVIQRDADGYAYTNSTSENFFSLAVKIKFNDFDYITAGDSPTPIESLITALPAAGSADVIHVNHHGSNSSSSPVYLDRLKPQLGFLSCGTNPYGHPSNIALQRLASASVITYLTGDCHTSQPASSQLIKLPGDIVLRSTNGSTYTVDGTTYQATDPSSASPNSILFFDDGEDGPGAWTVQGSWGLSSEVAYSGTYSWSDSPNGPYVQGTTSTLTLANPIVLPADRPAQLEFWDPTTLGTGADAFVDLSTDLGQSWVSVWHQTEVDFTDWGRQVVSLAPYAGRNILVRFRITVDPQAQLGDGWHIDDILISTNLNAATPTPTPTVTRTATSTITATVTPSETLTLTPTVVPTLTATAVPTQTLTPTETPSPDLTDTGTPTETSTLTITNTVTPTETPSLELTNTNTPTETVTLTVISTPTETPSPDLTNTSTPTETVTLTVISTLTETPTPGLTDTSAPTNTPIPGVTEVTSTFTPTATLTSVVKITRTPHSTHTPRSTNTPKPTKTVTLTRTLTRTFTPSPTKTQKATRTFTATLTATSTRTLTSTYTSSPTKAQKATKTATATLTVTSTRTAPPTKTATPTKTITPTPKTYPVTIAGLRSMLNDFRRLGMVDQEFYRPMDQILVLADRLFQNNHKKAAVDILRIFIAFTQHQRSHHVTPDAAQQLIDLAQKVIDTLHEH